MIAAVLICVEVGCQAFARAGVPVFEACSSSSTLTAGLGARILEGKPNASEPLPPVIIFLLFAIGIVNGSANLRRVRTDVR
jgi:hypothetical protein